MIIDIHRALIELYPDGAGYMQQGSQYSGLKWTDNRPKPTEEQIQAKIQELQAAEPIRLLRIERNQLLAETDWRMTTDYPYDDQAAWASYRTKLRDLPATAEPTLDENEMLTNITWPEVPNA